MSIIFRHSARNHRGILGITGYHPLINFKKKVCQKNSPGVPLYTYTLVHLKKATEFLDLKSL